MKKNYRNIMTIIIILICIIGVFLLIYLNEIIKESQKTRLINQDFKIKDIEWYGDTETWKDICNYTGLGEIQGIDVGTSSNEWKVGLYRFTTSQRYNLACKIIINEENMTESYGTYPFDNFGIGEKVTHNAIVGYYIDPFIDNNIKICCIPNNEINVIGEVCDSITLLAKC